MKEFEEELTLFIQEAIEAEIGGLRAVGQDSDDGQLREVRFGLRDSAFVLTIPSLVHEREIDGPLACRAFIYYTDDLENTPLVDVTVFEVDGGV